MLPGDDAGLWVYSTPVWEKDNFLRFRELSLELVDRYLEPGHKGLSAAFEAVADEISSEMVDKATLSGNFSTVSGGSSPQMTAPAGPGAARITFVPRLYLELTKAEKEQRNPAGQEKITDTKGKKRPNTKSQEKKKRI